MVVVVFLIFASLILFILHPVRAPAPSFELEAKRDAVKLANRLHRLTHLVQEKDLSDTVLQEELLACRNIADRLCSSVNVV